MTDPEYIPPPPPTLPASPLARDLEAIVERVFMRVVERVETSNAAVKDSLKHMLSELFEIKREIEHLKIRITAHDMQLASLMVALPPKGPGVKKVKVRRAYKR